MNLPGQQRIRLAFAEDHKLVRDGICSILNASGCFEIALEAGNGNELIDRLKQLESLPDICILDINMPVMDGYETLTRIRALWPAMKFLTLTMYRNEYAVRKMLRLGTNGYLLKNCAPQELKNALLSIYNTGSYDSDLALKYMRKAASNEGHNLPQLSEKELLFLSYCCNDWHYCEIADRMCVSPRTVEGYRDSLFHKLNVKTKTGLAMYAISMGIVTVS